MKLEFWYAPVTDLSAALALYRDTLGWEEAWREGELTASLALPGTEVQLMLDAHNAYVPGPIFIVDRVADFARRARGPAAVAVPAGGDPRRRAGRLRGSGGQRGLRDGPGGRVSH